MRIEARYTFCLPHALTASLLAASAFLYILYMYYGTFIFNLWVGESDNFKIHLVIRSVYIRIYANSNHERRIS